MRLSSPQPRERPLREIKMKEKVIAKYKNNRYYKSVVVGERNQLFYHVLFDDGTFSDNLFAQDIEVGLMYFWIWVHAFRVFSQSFWWEGNLLTGRIFGSRRGRSYLGGGNSLLGQSQMRGDLEKLSAETKNAFLQQN